MKNGKTEENPKVLVGCPVSDYHEYCTDEYLKAVKTLSYTNYDILLVDNSKDDGFFNSIKDEVPVIRTEYNENVYERIINSRNILRQKALEGAYDYFFSLEQDVIPPRNVIERLLIYKEDITTGLYFKPWDEENSKEPVAMIWVKHRSEPNKVVPVRGNILNGNNLVRVDFCGLGCILISKKVLEKIKFRYDPSDCIGTDDIFFCKDAAKHGFNIYADTAVKCKHLLSGRTWTWNDLLPEEI